MTKLVGIDFEYSRGETARPKLVCCSLMVDGSNKMENYWLYDGSQTDELKSRLNQLVGDRAIFVSHAVELAEGRCFSACLGIRDPNLLWYDTMLVEHMLNNRPKISHSGFSLSLVETLKRHKLILDSDEVSERKDLMRKIIIQDDEVKMESNKQEIMEYCASDVRLLCPLMKSQLVKAVSLSKKYCLNTISGQRSRISFGVGCQWNFDSADAALKKWLECFLEYSRTAWLFALIDSNGIPLKTDEVEVLQSKAKDGLYILKRRFNNDVAKIYECKMKRGRREVCARQKLLQSFIGEIVKENKLENSWPKSEKTLKWSLKDDILKQFQHIDPRLERLREHKKMCRALSSFTKVGDGNWLSTYDKDTGRIYPYHGFGMTQTFRNAHTPRSGFVPAWSKAMRTLQHPDKDHMLIAIDFKSEEFILGMDLRQDCVGVQSYLDGDVYVATAKRMGLLPKGEDYDPKAEYEGQSMKTIRGQAKGLVLGIGYGMGAKSLAARIGVDEDKAKEMIRQYKKLYCGMFDHISNENNCLDGSSTLVILPNGYNIKCPKLDDFTEKAAALYRKSVNNFPIQCGGAFILGEIVRRCFREGLKIITTVHDEVVVECRVEEVEDTIKTLSNIMIDSYQKLTGTRNVRVDPEVWGGDVRCDHLEDGNKSYFALLDMLRESEDIDVTFDDAQLYVDEDFKTNMKEGAN